MTELLDQGTAAIAAAVRTGKTSARDVAEAAIARVEARNKALTAIVDFDPAEPRAAADTVDSRRKQGFDGPILGVPYTVKDTTWVKGRRVTNGSLLWKDFKPPRDAVAVERLRNGGGVFLGMTNTPEMAAKGHTENKVYGPSRRPMNSAVTPGGSSGGAAAALGAGFTPIALGTDGGGSGRRPASHCGVVGLKTSAGAIPSPFGFGGAYGPLYGVVAPMGRAVADAKVALVATDDAIKDSSGNPIPFVGFSGTDMGTKVGDEAAKLLTAAGWLTSGKKVESRQQEVSEFSRQLKLLAKELDVPVVAISQLNRGPEQRTDKKPMLADLRESGSLEQDADMVMLIHRPDAWERDDPRAGEADLILAKHRNGPTTTVTVAHQLHYSRFNDMAQG